ARFPPLPRPGAAGTCRGPDGRGRGDEGEGATPYSVLRTRPSPSPRPLSPAAGSPRQDESPPAGERGGTTARLPKRVAPPAREPGARSACPWRRSFGGCEISCRRALDGRRRIGRLNAIPPGNPKKPLTLQPGIGPPGACSLGTASRRRLMELV